MTDLTNIFPCTAKHCAVHTPHEPTPEPIPAARPDLGVDFGKAPPQYRRRG